jgi:hypothetical protein
MVEFVRRLRYCVPDGLYGRMADWDPGMVMNKVMATVAERDFARVSYWGRDIT